MKIMCLIFYLLFRGDRRGRFAEKERAEEPFNTTGSDRDLDFRRMN